MFFELCKKGLSPHYFAIDCQYMKEDLRDYAKSLELLEYYPDDKPIDEIKFTLANNHPELIKYGDRCKDNSVNSWHLQSLSSQRKYEKACDILGYSYDVIDFSPMRLTMILLIHLEKVEDTSPKRQANKLQKLNIYANIVAKYFLTEPIMVVAYIAQTENTL